MEEATRKTSAAWMPEMSDVRRAHVAQADALETVVSALVSKQQASIAALRRQVEAIVEWQSGVEAQNRANGGQGVASYSSGGYDQQQAVVARGQVPEKAEQGGVADVAGSADGTRQSWAKGKQQGVDDAGRSYDNKQSVEERSSARGEQGIAGAAAAEGYPNQPTDEEQSQAREGWGSAAGGDYPTIDGQSQQAIGGQGTADATGDNSRPIDVRSQARGEQDITDAEGSYSQPFDGVGQASGEHGDTYKPVDDIYQPADVGQSQPRGEQGNFQPIDGQSQPRGDQGVAGVIEGGSNFLPLEVEVQTRGEQGSHQPIDGQSQGRGERGVNYQPVGDNFQAADGRGQERQPRGEPDDYPPIDVTQSQARGEQGMAVVTGGKNQPMRVEMGSYNQPFDRQGRPMGDQGNYRPIDGQSQATMRGYQGMAGAGGGYGQRTGEQGQAREGQGTAAGYYKTIDGQVRMRGEQRSGGVAKGAPSTEDLALIMHRVAALEKDVVKIEGLWDKDKGQRVIEVWMSLLKKTTFKPSNWRSYSPRVCAVMTLQNWWRHMLADKLDWSPPSERNAPTRGRSGSSSSSSVDGTATDGNKKKKTSGPQKAVGQTESGLLQPPGTVEAGPSSNKEQSLPAGMKEMFLYRQEPATPDLESQRDPADSGDGSSSTPPIAGHDQPTAVTTAAVESEMYRREREPSSAEISPNQPGRNEEGTGDPTGSKPHSGSGELLQLLRNSEGGSNDNDDAPKGSKHDIKLTPARGKAQHGTTTEVVVESTKQDDGQEPKRDRHEGAPSVGSTAVMVVTAGSKAEGVFPAVVHPGGGVGEGVKRSDSSHHHDRAHSKNEMHPLQQLKMASGGSNSSIERAGGGVQGMFEGALGQSPILMMTSMAMQLQSLETEIDNLRQRVESIELSLDGQSRSKHHVEPTVSSFSAEGGTVSSADFIEMGRHLGQLQRELHGVRNREEERDRRTELSLEAIEALIGAREEDSDRRFQEQAQENADRISKLLEQLDAQGLQEKSDIVRKPLLELKVELRSLYTSLAAISANEVSATQLRSLEGIRHLLASLAERAGVLEEEIGDPARLARCIAADDVVARRFADMATDLGTTLFAFIKAQVLQARRARDGKFADNAHRRRSNPEDATAVITANLAGGGGGDGATAAVADNEGDGGRAGTSASPQAWAKLSYLSYTRQLTGETLPFPAGLVVLLKAISDVLNHCVGTGDLAIRLSVTLEDLTLYVAQRADKEKESILRQLSAPIDSVRAKLGGMEGTLAGFQRTMHLVLSEVDADRERAAAIEALGYTVHSMQDLFSRVSDELKTKAGALEIEEALQEMTAKIEGSADEQSRLQRLARTLGRDQNSTTAMKRLQIELEQARTTAVLALAQRDTDVLIGSRCLSCNRPLGGFMPPQLPNKDRTAWTASAGGSRAQRDRFIEATTAGGVRSGTGNSGTGANSRGDGGSVCSSGSGESIGTPKTSGHAQAATMPGNIWPLGSDLVGSAPGTAPGTAPKKALKGPILFERTREADGAPSPSGLRGRVLRPGVSPISNEVNVSISKYPRLVPLTAPKSAQTTAQSNHRRSA